MATLIKVAALVAFSIVTKTGVIHGDPENSDEKAQYPMVPEDRVDDLLAAGKIALLEEDEPKAEPKIKGDAKPKRSTKAGAAAAEPAAATGEPAPPVE